MCVGVGGRGVSASISHHISVVTGSLLTVTVIKGSVKPLGSFSPILSMVMVRYVWPDFMAPRWRRVPAGSRHCTIMIQAHLERGMMLTFLLLLLLY